MTETCPNCGEELTSDNAAGGLCGRCLFERGIELTNTVALAEGSTPGTHPFTAPDPVEVEADLLNFDVLELIGQGGMGAVYKAYQRTLDRTVAIKILPRQAAGGQEFAQRFQREARALARLRHEHIVMAYDYGLTDRYLYSVMEYVGGPNLREFLRSKTKPLSPAQCSHHAPRDEISLPDESQRECAASLSPRRALEIARDVCAALQFAHENGIVHRDIKPENILLDESGRVKIADFGLAKLLQPDPCELALTHTRHFMGTLHYMAPEQCERPHETDHRADIYSLGVLLYEMLTSELPLGRFDSPSSRANVDSRVDDVVLRALEKDPARRYQTAAAFREAITSVLEQLKAPHSATAQPAVASDARRTRPRGPLVAAGFLAFLVVAYFGWQFLLKYQRDKEGNTTITVESKGGDEKPPKVASQETRLLRADEEVTRAFTLRRDNFSEISDLVYKIFSESAEIGNAGGHTMIARGNSETIQKIEALVRRLNQATPPIGEPRDLSPQLLEEQIDREPQVLELRKRIADVEKLHEYQRSVSTNPKSDQALWRYNQRLETLKQAEEELKAQLRELAMRSVRKSVAQGPTTKIFSLSNSNAAEVSKAVRKVYPEGIDYYMGTDTLSNSLVATGDPEKIAKIEAVVRHLDAATQKGEKAGRANSEIKIFLLQNSRAAEALAMLRKLYPDSQAVRMTADARTNSLIVEGNRETLSKIEAILLRLDERGSPDASDGPTTIQREHVLHISATGEFEDAPLDGRYGIDLDGYVNLGAKYGKIKVLGLTADKAQEAILAELRKILSDPKVVLSIEDPSGGTTRAVPNHGQPSSPVRISREGVVRISASGTVPEGPINGLYTVDLDGYVNLGAEYGKVKIAGRTADQAQEAILNKLREVLARPKVILTIEAVGPQNPADLKDAVSTAQEKQIRTVVLNEWELEIDQAGGLVDSRRLTNEEFANRVEQPDHVTILPIPKYSIKNDDGWPPRSEDLPIGLAHALLFNDFGTLAVAYRFYDHTPTTMIVRGERGDEQVVIPYVLVIKGPHLGRKEFVLPNWPERDKVQELVRTPGIIFAPANLRINNGEPLEIFIERGDPRNTSRVRVSNIVKLTWDVANLPRQADEATDEKPKETQPSTQEPKDKKSTPPD